MTANPARTGRRRRQPRGHRVGLLDAPIACSACRQARGHAPDWPIASTDSEECHREA